MWERDLTNPGSQSHTVRSWPIPTQNWQEGFNYQLEARVYSPLKLVDPCEKNKMTPFQLCYIMLLLAQEPLKECNLGQNYFIDMLQKPMFLSVLQKHALAYLAVCFHCHQTDNAHLAWKAPFIKFHWSIKQRNIIHTTKENDRNKEHNSFLCVVYLMWWSASVSDWEETVLISHSWQTTPS